MSETLYYKTVLILKSVPIGRGWNPEAWDEDIWEDAAENLLPLTRSPSHLLA